MKDSKGETKAVVVKTRSKLWVELSNCGNPDFGQNSHQPLPGTRCLKKGVMDIIEARKEVLEYIKTNKLKGGNWTGGLVTDTHGKEIATISFNGRIWQIDPSVSNQTLKKPFRPVVLYNRIRHQLTICYSHIFKEIKVDEKDLVKGEWRFIDPLDVNKGVKVEVGGDLVQGKINVAVYHTEYISAKGWQARPAAPTEQVSLILETV